MFNFILKLGFYAKKRKYRIIQFFCSLLLRILYSFQFNFNEKIGENVLFCYYGLGIVIHDKAVIGDNVIIAQHVTIGGRSKNEILPIIGNDVYIGVGSIVLGNIKIGNNVVVGAGSIVISDIPNNCVVAGAPAKIIRENINNYRDYF